ncbi:MAG: hypothetical protein ACKVP2_08220 [Burkholderiales bacterium]
MSTLWPWLAIAGLGALHGLIPANGWMFAAAWGVHARDGAQARRALLPIAIGHATFIAVVACAVAQSMSMDRALVRDLAGALLIGTASYRLLCSTEQRRPISTRASHAGIAPWSFLMATAHGAGLMLVPALMPLCLAGSAAREMTASRPLVLALAAVAVHTAAMLVTTGVIATGVCRGIALHPGLLGGTALRRAWTAALAVTGVLLMVLR